MNGRGDGSQNNRNGRQVNPENLPSGDQEPVYEPAFEPIGGFWGLLNSLYHALYDIFFWRLIELLDELEERYDVFDIDNVNDGNVNNVNIHNINVRDNNANVDNNELHDDHDAVVVDIENDDSDEAFEDCEDVYQYIPEEDPQPGVSRRRPREMDEEDVEPNKRFRWSEEFSDDDSDFISACDTDSEGCPHAGNIADEDINQQVTEEEQLPVGSTKRSRKEDGDEEEPNSKKSRLTHMKSLTTMKLEARGSGPERILRKKWKTCVFANFGGVQMSPPAPVMTTNTIPTGFSVSF
ncbi:spermatogenesis-associated protein 2 [Sarotherodon galilaeus]